MQAISGFWMRDEWNVRTLNAWLFFFVVVERSVGAPDSGKSLEAVSEQIGLSPSTGLSAMRPTRPAVLGRTD